MTECKKCERLAKDVSAIIDSARQAVDYDPRLTMIEKQHLMMFIQKMADRVSK